MYNTEIERRIRRSKNQDDKKANVVSGLPTGYSSVKRRSTGPTVHIPTIHKHLIPIIHIFQNSPSPTILLNYNVIISINNMNPNKQRLRFTPHRISMQQQAKFLNASRDRATWPLTMLP